MIREATTDDIPLMARLLAAMLEDIAVHGGGPVADEPARQAFFARLLTTNLTQPSWRHIVADDGGIVGAASAQVRTPPSAFAPRHTLHISTTYVVPERRDQGIGRMLVVDLLDWGRARRCDEVDLGVVEGNPARRLYERMGFTTVKRQMLRRL